MMLLGTLSAPAQSDEDFTYNNDGTFYWNGLKLLIDGDYHLHVMGVLPGYKSINIPRGINLTRFYYLQNGYWEELNEPMYEPIHHILINEETEVENITIERGDWKGGSGCGLSLTGCSHLKTITFSYIHNAWDDQEFWNSIINFSGFPNLTSVSIKNSDPNTKVLIDRINLDGCTSLIHVELPEILGSCPSFQGCTSLKEIKIQKGWNLNNSGYNFKNCTALSNVTIENGVTEIPHGMFDGCSSLKKLDHNTIPGSVAAIREGAFSGCIGLESVTIPGNVKSIEERAFVDCSQLNSLTISNGVESIDEKAFAGCTKLPEVTIPSSAKKIGDQAFSGCTNLASVSIGGDGLEIGSSVFENCTSLTDVIIEEGEKIYYYSPFIGCTNLRSMTVRGPITSFNGFMPLFDNTTMPNNIYIEDVNTWCNSSIGIEGGLLKRYHLFLNGKKVEHLKIPEGVTTIIDCAFCNCASLKSVILPKSMTSIGKCAFFNCDSLLLVMSPMETPCAFGGDIECSIDLYYAELDLPDGYTIFKKYDDYCVVKKDLLTAYVPLGTITIYENTIGWNKFPNILDWVPTESVDPEKLYPAPHHSHQNLVDGDVDGNGVVDQNDLIALVNYIMGKAPADFDDRNTNINGDGKVDVVDVVKLVDIIKQNNNTVDTPDGVEAVDLGLPSGTKWANMNMGATAPEDFGLYFAWGETTGYTSDTNDGHSFDWTSYLWCDGDYNKLTKYCPIDNTDCWGGDGTPDNILALTNSDDAARNWGSEWRIPTCDDFKELIGNTICEWTTLNGVTGYKFTSTTNSNYIFLPAAGDRWEADLYAGSAGKYWASMIVNDSPYNAYYMYFNSNYASWENATSRHAGLPVRPVR